MLPSICLLATSLLLPRLPQLRRAPAPQLAAPAVEFSNTSTLGDLYGVELNEEERVTVSFLGSAASRERRVRRTVRPNKEERWQNSPEPAGYKRMSAFCTVDSINLEDAIDRLTGFSSFGERLSITSYTDVVHCRFFTKPMPQFPSLGDETMPPPAVQQPSIRDAFLFPYGSTILWGFTSSQELKFLEDLQPCCTPIQLLSGDAAGGSDADDELADSEFMLYELADDEKEVSVDRGESVALSNNVIRLSNGDDVFEKLAISFAFAQSAKLAVFEAALEATTEEIRPIPAQLAKRGRARLAVNEVARLTGRVFLERNAVNLYSNILDTPDFFWEAEEFEPLYRRVNRYLDIETRVSILNKRLDIVNDLLDSLSTQLEIRNSHRLEIIIIGLIALEIALEVLKEAAFYSSLPPLALWPRRTLGITGGGVGFAWWRWRRRERKGSRFF